MKITEISCKTALNTSKLPGLDYTLNPYIGCQHQCIYCYAPGILHLNREKWETSIKVKRNIPNVLSEELKKKTPGTIGLSTVTDAYQPLEKTYKITRYCLEQLKKHCFPICIQTKSDLILRDTTLIKQIHNVEVMVSIGTLNETYQKLLEPGSSTIQQRLSILKAFKNTQVKTSVFFGPIYPTITIDTLPNILDVFIDLEIDELMIDYFHMKKEIIPSFTNLLRRHQQLPSSFSIHHLQKQKTMFPLIRSKIYDYLKHTNITVIDAFPS